MGLRFTCRPAGAGDEAFLEALYADTRAEELAPTGWDEAAKVAFCRQQFRLQRAHYETHFPDAVHEILEVEGVPAGRLWVDWRDAEARLLDVALRATHRGQGLGTAVLRQLMDAAAERGLAVTLNVEHNNPRAKRLYARLGFRVLRDIGTHDFMEWTPAGPHVA